MDKPKIFIASPLFNPEQVAIIETIEKTLTRYGYDFYSARLHSGSDKLSPEERKDLKAWDPVFQSNVQGLDECDAMIAVLEYAMPLGQSLRRVNFDKPGNFFDQGGNSFEAVQIELPDAGTVWEMGYHAAKGRPILGFHTDKARHLNLMLSHGVTGMLRGWEALESFLSEKTPYPDLPSQLSHRNVYASQCAMNFNWKACTSFDAANKEVE